MGNENEETRPPHISPFEAIREEAEDGSEYWSARDLSKILGYTEWRNFTTAIEKAKEACQNSGQGVSDHFVEANKLIEAGKGAQRKIEELGGTLPEDLPTPAESIQQLQRKEQKQLQDHSQPSLFDAPEDGKQAD